jgi:mxaJ protein
MIRMNAFRAACAVMMVAVVWVSTVEAMVLRVCAAADNLPFSNDRQEGYENKILELIARDLGASLEYVWTPLGASTDALAGGRCDLTAAVTQPAPSILTTRPYYQAGYVFVTRRSRRLGLRSLMDPRLKQLTLGIHTSADRVHDSLLRRLEEHGLKPQPFDTRAAERTAGHRSMLAAVAHGRLDAGILWAPLAAEDVSAGEGTLEINPIVDVGRSGPTHVSVGVSMGLAPASAPLRPRLQSALDMHRAEINAILDQYSVPRSTAGVHRMRNAQILRPPH